MVSWFYAMENFKKTLTHFQRTRRASDDAALQNLTSPVSLELDTITRSLESIPSQGPSQARFKALVEAMMLHLFPNLLPLIRAMGSEAHRSALREVGQSLWNLARQTAIKTGRVIELPPEPPESYVGSLKRLVSALVNTLSRFESNPLLDKALQSAKKLSGMLGS